jgi:delta14-sterol reductase
MTTFALLLAGTITQGANFPVWTYMWEHHLQILTANILIAYFLSTFVYVRSFSVKPGNTEKRELALGGQSGNMLYDWFIGRELNPRIILPFFGEIDIKVFMEMRPGLMGWIILNFSNIAHQYRTYGIVSDSIIGLTVFQTIYVLDSYYMESSMLTTIDITTDGFGCMLAFGDVVWVPFIYSLQTRYLSVYPHILGLYGILGVLAPAMAGYYIFRSSNNEKNRFRTNPDDPRISHLKFMETKSGSKLLISGWWGTARHINYCGDWLQSWSYVLPTGLAGYVIQRTGAFPREGTFEVQLNGVPQGYEVLPGEAKGWGVFITYFYIVYFGVLLVHRALRDEDKCLRKYGADWQKYKNLVPWKIIPGIY